MRDLEEKEESGVWCREISFFGLLFTIIVARSECMDRKMKLIHINSLLNILRNFVVFCISPFFQSERLAGYCVYHTIDMRRLGRHNEVHAFTSPPHQHHILRACKSECML